MSSRCHRAICREGVYYLLMVAAVFAWALLQEANLLLLVGGMLCAPWLLNWWLCRSALWKIDARRRLVPAVTAGTPLHVEVELSNSRRRLGSWGLTVEDRLERLTGGPQQAILQPSAFALSLAAGQTRRATYRVVLPRRGRYRFGPLRLSSRFPFGLFRCVRTIADERLLTVYPRIGRLSPAWQRRCQPSAQGTVGANRAGRAPGDFFAVRQWQSGDSPRWVHWRSSARQGRLIVRQFEQPAHRHLMLLVDLWQPARPQPQDLEEIEGLISFAATVAADLCRRSGFQLHVGLTGDPPGWFSGPAHSELLTRILEALAVVEASDRERLPALLKLAHEAGPEHAEVLLLSPRAGVELAGPWPGAKMFGGRLRTLGPAEPAFGEYFKVS